jgi:hypothetical protein
MSLVESVPASGRFRLILEHASSPTVPRFRRKPRGEGVAFVGAGLSCGEHVARFSAILAIVSP